MATTILIVQKILRFFLAVVWLLLTPIFGLQSLKKRKQLPPIRNKLLLLSATEIAGQIREKQISCQEVIEAYIERCKVVNPIINAIVEECFEAAIQEAREIDAFLKSTTKTEEELAREMPLLGVPITVKESIAVEGMSYSVGVKKPNPVVAREDATVVKMIRDAGGIIILVSNTPELCMAYETFNKVTGTTWNPYDTRRTAGGSSGGEAALLGAGASVLSLASDIGGSARLPAMFCGVYGHKPSPGFVPCIGHKPEAGDERWGNFFTISPMVRYAEDLPLILKAMSQSADVHHIFREKIHLKNINVFFMEEFNTLITTPVDQEIKLVIRKAKRHMETVHRIKVQKASLRELKYAFNIAATELLSLKHLEGIFSKDDDVQGKRSILKEVLKFFLFLSPHTLPPMGLELIRYISNKFPKSYKKKIAMKLSLLRNEFLELLGNNSVLIHPTFVSSAHYKYFMYYNLGNISYLMIYNALGFPVTQCPMGLNSKGLPIGLQIVAAPGCDHLTIAVAQELERAFGGWQEPSYGRRV